MAARRRSVARKSLYHGRPNAYKARAEYRVRPFFIPERIGAFMNTTAAGNDGR